MLRRLISSFFGGSRGRRGRGTRRRRGRSGGGGIMSLIRRFLR